MIVYKFGGTSLADADRIRAAARLVRECGSQPVVVVSALGGVTNELAAMVKDRAAGAEDDLEERAEALRRRHEEVAEALTTASSRVVSRVPPRTRVDVRPRALAAG